MKKFTSFLTMAMIALLSLSFTSCDEDADIAYTLNGSWRGDMYVQYDNNQSIYSEITFNSGYDSGTGYWIDYYDRGYWGGRDYVANHIRWQVRNGNIDIYFMEEDTYVTIYDYSLTDYYFSGYIEAENGNRARFRLTKTSGYHDWDDYYWGWDDGYWDWNKTTGTPVEGIMSRSVASDNLPGSADKPTRKFVVKE